MEVAASYAAGIRRATSSADATTPWARQGPTEVR